MYDAPSGSFVLTQEPPSQVMVEVRGTGFELLGEQWSLNGKPLKLDLNRAKESNLNNTYYIPTLELRTRLIRTLGDNLNLRYISPDTLYFKTEIRFRKKIPVVADIQLDYESGYNQRSAPQLKPDSVWISGPSSFIDTIQFISSEKLIFSQLKDTLNQELRLQRFQVEGVRVEPRSVQLSVAVEKFTEKELKIKLKQINRFDKRELKTFPNEITASFLVPLSKYEYLDTSVVKGIVEYTVADVDKKKLDIQLIGTPPFAKLLKLETDKVEYIIRE